MIPISTLYDKYIDEQKNPFDYIVPPPPPPPPPSRGVGTTRTHLNRSLRLRQKKIYDCLQRDPMFKIKCRESTAKKIIREQVHKQNPESKKCLQPDFITRQKLYKPILQPDNSIGKKS